MKTITLVASGLVGIGLMCCGTDSVDCPFPATSCAPGCGPMDAYEVDRQRGCRERVILGCNAPKERTTDTACHFEPATGRIVYNSSSDLAVMSGWRNCTADEAASAPRAPLSCEDVDGGGT